MKRIAAAMALFFIAATPGAGLAATLRPADQDGLNLRSGPGTGFQVVGTLAPGQALPVTAERDGWYRVRTGSGQEAWVAGWFARINLEDEQALALVNTDVLNVRKEPKTTAAVLAKLSQNEPVRLLEMVPEWWRVRTAAGVEGWVAAQYMRRAPAAQQPAPPPAQQPAKPPTQQPVTPPTQQPVKPPTQQPAPPPAQQPAKPPTQQPVTPPAPPPPAAPASAVPKLPLLPPALVVNTAGAKQVVALKNDIVYEGRDREAFEWAGTINAGEKLTYLDAAEGWVKVQTARRERGWVPGASVAVTEGKLLFELAEGRWTAGQQAPPAPAPAPAQPAGGKYVERRTVKDADGLRLREKPDGKIITVLPQGEVLEIQSLKMPWIQVKTEKGLLGWVHVDYTLPYTPPAPQAKPAFSNDWKATLTARTPGVLMLEIDAPGKTIGDPVAEGNLLRITLPPTGQAQPAVLPVSASGVRTLSVAENTLTLAMESLPSWQVTRKEPGKLTVVLRPSVTAAAVRELADRTVYEFKVTGPVQPLTRAAGTDVVVEFPGAIAGWPAVPQGLKLQATERGVQAAIASRRPYTLRRVTGGFELHLLKPGLAGKTILLDPGHGGVDGGAVNKSTGIRESDVNLQVALRLRALLAARGANVLMTRITDTRVAPPEVLKQGPQDDLGHVDLGYRTRMANEVNADLFLSIHHNCCTGSGTETYYTSGILNGDRSAQIARLLQKEVAPGLGQIDRGAFDDLMYVTRTTDVPAALLEIAFISHKIEGLLVGRGDYQEQTVRLIANALEKFFAER